MANEAGADFAYSLFLIPAPLANLCSSKQRASPASHIHLATTLRLRARSQATDHLLGRQIVEGVRPESESFSLPRIKYDFPIKNNGPGALRNRESEERDGEGE